MYINSNGAEVSNVNGRSVSYTSRDLKRRSHKIKSELPYDLIGGTIKINNNLNNNFYEKGNGTRHRFQYTVRGHYHHFWKNKWNVEDKNSIVAYGELGTKDENKVLIRKWVAPYIKGDELAELINKEYVLEE
jgi:hypothetical protein